MLNGISPQLKKIENDKLRPIIVSKTYIISVSEVCRPVGINTPLKFRGAALDEGEKF